MTLVPALVLGYLAGGMPTADWIAGWKGIDLRSGGSRNPGANNAWRLGGLRLAATILAVELLKGAAIVLLAQAAGGEAAMVAAGVGAVAGNVVNPYRRLAGGQGLGITGGVLAGSCPAMAVTAVVVIGAVAWRTRSSAIAALSAVTALVAFGAILPPGPWGIGDGPTRLALAIGLAVVIAPKQIVRLTRSDRRGSRGSASPDRR